MKIPYISGLKVSGQVELKNLPKQDEPVKILTLDGDNNVNFADYVPFSGSTSLVNYYTKVETDSNFVFVSGLTWSNLTGKPFIPTDTTHLTNGAGFISSESDTLDTVLGRGNTSNKDITVSGSATFSTKLTIPIAEPGSATDGSVWIGNSIGTGYTAPVVSYLNDLQDVSIDSPTLGESLVWDGAEWVNENITVDLSNYYTKTESDGLFTEDDTLHSVTTRGNSTGNDILLSGITTVNNQLLIPTVNPLSALDGSVWIGSATATGYTAPAITYVNDLQDVVITTPSTGQALVYSSGSWINQTIITDAEPSFSKNTAFNKNFGTGSGTVAEGNDSRILNGQTAYSWGNHSGLYPSNGGSGASGTWGINVTGNAATASVLQTSRTLWGQSFNGSANVTGSLIDVTDITGSGIISIPRASFSTQLIAPLAAPSSLTDGSIWVGAASGTGTTTTIILNLNDLQDVSLTSLTSGQGIVWNGSNWVNQNITVSGYNNTNWDTSYSWGNHATYGYITAASVGNGTLTMNVSGGGLSGSGSFTANQSGGSTFTVTSNATTAATANTLVLRDSGPDITTRLFRTEYTGAGGTGAYFIVQNAIGSGTDNYMRVMPASDAMGVIRSNASGSWAINITGNAASATNWAGWALDYSTAGTTLAYLFGGDGSAATQRFYTAGVVRTFLGMPSGGDTLASVTARGASTTAGITVNGSLMMGGSWIYSTGLIGIYNSTSATHFYSDEAGHYTLAGTSMTAGGLKLKDTHAGTTKGRLYWDSTGMGLLSNTDNWGVRVNHGGGASPGGQLYGSWNVSGNFTVNGNYYVSNYGQGLVGIYSATLYQGVFAMGDAYKLADGGTSPGSLYGLAWTHSNIGGQSIAGLGHQLLVMAAGVTQTSIGDGIWTRSNVYAAGNMYSNGVQVVYNSGTWGINISGSAATSTYSTYLWSTSHTGSYYISNAWTGTHWQITSNHGAPVRVGYADQAGNADTVDGYHSNNFIGKNGTSYYQPDTWIQLGGNYGFYYAPTGAQFEPNSLSSYTQWMIQGSKGSYGGIYDRYSGVSIGMYDSAGNGGVYREANALWYFYYSIANGCMGIGSSTTTAGYAAQVNGSLRVTGQIYADTTGYFGGDVIAYYSDSRLKESIKPIENALYKVNQLRGVHYVANNLALHLGAAKDKRSQVGVIAQDFIDVLPEVLELAPFDMLTNEEGNVSGSKSGQNYKTVKYERIVPLLIEAVKELSAKVERLEGRNN